MKKRPPLSKKFHVLVVPEQDVTLDLLAIPATATPTNGRVTFRFAAHGNTRGSTASFWGFGGNSREQVIDSLRTLADWLEDNPPI